jgi:hypothetical protein
MVSKIEQEVNEIRLRIYEIIKDMTPQECTEYYRKSAEALAKEFGFRTYSSIEEARRDREARRETDTCES